MNGVLVELAGLPGSGKSVLAETLVRRLRADGVPSMIVDAGVSARARREVRMIRRAGYALRETAAEPIAARRATSVIMRSRQQARRDVPAVLAQWLGTARLVARSRRQPGVNVFEEGLVQTVWTALLRSQRLRPEQLWLCLPPAAYSDVVLYLDTGPQLAADRLAARDSRHSRVQSRPTSSMATELSRGQALFDDVLRTCPLQVVRVPSAGETPATLAERAVGAILESVGSLPPTGPDLRPHAGRPAR